MLNLNVYFDEKLNNYFITFFRVRKRRKTKKNISTSINTNMNTSINKIN